MTNLEKLMAMPTEEFLNLVQVETSADAVARMLDRQLCFCTNGGESGCCDRPDSLACTDCIESWLNSEVEE